MNLPAIVLWVRSIFHVSGFVLFSFFMICALVKTHSEDWPRFLGPAGNNTSPETGLLERWPINGPPILWSKPVGTGYSAPSVSAGKLVLHHRLKAEEIVECFDAATGEVRWRYAYESRFIDPYGYNNGPRCTPWLTSNLCYTFGAEGKLLCLTIDAGKLVWQRDTAKDWQVPEAFFGVGSTPLLEDDKLIVLVGGQPNSGVVAFDARTGRTIWESVGKKTWQGVTTIGWRSEIPYNWSGQEKQASYASPVAATIHGARHLLCLMRQGLVSLNPTNGRVNFNRWFQSFANDSVNAMTPVVQDDLVLISAAYYRSGAALLRVSPDGKSFEERWRYPKHPFDAQDRDPATGRWKQPVLEIHWNTPVLHEGCLYAFSGRNEPDATFRCVEFRTGKLRWSRDEQWAGHPPPGAAAQPDVYGRGSAILADGKLIVLGEGGLLGLFKPNSNQAEELSRWQPPELHYPCWAAPVLSEKRLYLRSEDRLVCLNLAKPGASKP
ncbi:MAG: PQQ-like beta-propeller repeat protein [Verrucomicrobiales bacterium]|nr:PQQ-like beta-propeller repeat protein [Verrucomicrobiales bacterium]